MRAYLTELVVRLLPESLRCDAAVLRRAQTAERNERIANRTLLDYDTRVADYAVQVGELTALLQRRNACLRRFRGRRKTPDALPTVAA